jgi:hypothetical protein
MRGGRETAPQEKPEPSIAEESLAEEGAAAAPEKSETRLEKKRDRRRHYRRRRGREEAAAAGREATGPESMEIGEEKTAEALYKETEAGKIELPEPKKGEEEGEVKITPAAASFLTSLLPPPPNLISETIARYKDNALFKQAFYLKEEEEEEEERNGKPEAPSTEEAPTISLQQPAYGTFEVSEEEEEEIYHQRKRQEEREKEGHRGKGEQSEQQPPLESKDEVSNNNK